MSKGQMQTVLQHIRGLAVGEDAAALADNELLERFLTRHDQGAFEALVRRHGPMVLGVCRRVLQDPHDAEDAFQATFLVFVRKAAAIRKRELMGNWLYGVAYRTARAARSAAGRRRAKEAKAVPRQQPPEADVWQELQPLLDQELSRMPDKYRIAIVLCDLQEKSRQEAAQQLGLPEGTLSSRLARGRALLARRLQRRGFALTAGTLTAGLGQQASATVLPPALVLTTVQAGALTLAGQPAAAGVISAQVVALSEGVVRAMFLSKLKVITMALLAGSLLVAGVGKVASRSQRAEASPGVAASSVKKDAKEVLQQALEAARTIADPSVRFDALMKIAVVQNQTGDAAGARKTCQEALALAKTFANGRPKVSALTRVAFAQSEAGDRDAIPQTLQQAEQNAAAIEDAHEKGNAFMDIVFAQAGLGDYEAALRTAAASGDFQSAGLMRLGMTFWTTSPVKEENKPAARKVLRQALDMAKAIESKGQLRQVVDAVAAAQATLGDLEGALQTADLLDANSRFTALEAIAGAQIRAGNVAGALQTASTIQWDVSKARTLQTIALAQARRGDGAGAKTTLKEARQLADDLQKREAARPVQRGRPSQFPGNFRSGIPSATTEIALTQQLLGDSSGARQTISAIDSVQDKARALLDIGIAQAQAGKQADARETLLEASHVAQNIMPNENRGDGDGRFVPGRGRDSESAKAATMRRIAQQQAKLGDVKEGLRTAERIPTDNERDIALAALAPAQAKAGNVKAALETVAQIKSEIWKGLVLEDLVQAQMKAGDERGALAVVAQQTSPALKAHALVGVALASTKQKAPKQ
jgi:RNA polymerase sigma factor (sigma-70 family)